MMRRVAAVTSILVLLSGCGAGSEKPISDGTASVPRTRSRGLVGSARAPTGVIVRVKQAERTSPTAAQLTVQIFNPGAVPLAQTVGPESFYVAAQGSNADPTASADIVRSTFKKTRVAPRESAEGIVYLKLPGAGPVEVFYGDTPEVSVRVITIAP